MAALRTYLSIGALLALVLAGAASAQTAQNIAIVQGNGQLICDSCAGLQYNFFDDIVVRVTDAGGNPVPNATVNWAQTGGSGLLLFGTQTTTGSSTSASANICDQIGQSCNRYNGSDTNLRIHAVINVVASLSNGNNVTFTLTEAPPVNSSQLVDSVKPALLVSPDIQTSFVGPAGTTSSTPIIISVQTVSGSSLGSVSVQLIPSPDNPANGPTISCAAQTGADPGSILSDATGVATCNPVFGPVASKHEEQFYVLVGGVLVPQNQQTISTLGPGPLGFAKIGPFRFTVTPSDPAAITVISGDNQNAARGSTLPSSFVVKVTTADGNPLALAPITWTASPSDAATIAPASQSTGTDGKVSATVSLTNTAVGTVHIIAKTANGFTTTFTITVNVQVTGLTKVSSTDNQSVHVGEFFQPVTVQVQVGGGQPPVGIPVQFSITGPGALGQTSAAANAQGLAAVGVSAGNTAGTVTIVASVGGFSTTFTLTVLPPGLNITQANFLNGAGFYPTGDAFLGALSPCGIGTFVYGVPLTPSTLPATPNLFAAPVQKPSIASIKFGEKSAAILSVTGDDIQRLVTFQVPCDLSPVPGNFSVNVTLNGVSTLQPVSVPVHNASPGIFEIPMSDGARRALLVKPDGSFVSLENPARPGETMRSYVTGVGPAVPPLIPVTNGQPILPIPGSDTPAVDQYIIVFLNGSGVEVTSQRVSPDLIGVHEISFQIPSNAPDGDLVLVMGVVVHDGDAKQFSQLQGSKVVVRLH